MHILGHKPSQEIRFFGAHDDDRQEEYQAVYLAKAIETRGGTEADYSFFYFDSQGDIARRITNGDLYEAVWENGVITGVSFAPEDTKRTIYAIAGKAAITANGVDSTMVRLEIRDSGGVSVEPLNVTRLVAISSPSGRVKRRCVFINGVCEFPFVTTQAGPWTFPSDNFSVENVRITQFATVEALVAF